MPTSTKYILTATPDRVLDLRLKQGTLSLSGQTAAFTCGAGVDSVYATAGMSVHFTASGGATAVLYLDGALADYAVSASATVVTLTRGPDSYQLGLTEGHEFAFTHGHASALDVATHGASARLRVPTGAALVSPVTSSASVGLSCTSAGVITAGGMRQLTLRGPAGVEQVVIKAAMPDGIRLPAGHADIIWFTGQWADYTRTAAGNTLTFERSIQRQGDGTVTAHESVTVMGGAGTLHDRLVFTDGYIHFEDAVAHTNAADLSTAGGKRSTVASAFTPAWAGTPRGAYLPAARVVARA